MKSHQRPSQTGINLVAAAVFFFTFVALMHAEQTPAERISEIQAALRNAKLDGWLFYDFRHSDPLAYRILKLDEKMLASRRWFYSRKLSESPIREAPVRLRSRQAVRSRKFFR